MIVHIHKPRLPKGRGYALKTSSLEPVLKGVSCDVILDYWTPQPGLESVLWAEWWLPNENRGTTLFIRAGSLPLAELKAARMQLDAILAEFKVWLRTVASLPPSSAELAAEPRFSATLECGALRVSRHPRSPASRP